jgi:hypothetical protein
LVDSPGNPFQLRRLSAFFFSVLHLRESYEVG